MENKRSRNEFKSNDGENKGSNEMLSDREKRKLSRQHFREEKAALVKFEEEKEREKQRLAKEAEQFRQDGILQRMRARRQEKEYKINEQFLLFENLDKNPFVALYIHEYGRLTCPVDPEILLTLKKFMTKSTTGVSKDGRTFDEEIPQSWELKPKKFDIAYPKVWTDFVNNTVLSRVIEKLGLGHKNIIAKLNKFILYETGSFFEKHMDHEKDLGNFGSLVIDLPSVYTGGQFIWEYKTEIKTIDNESTQSATGSYYLFYNIVENGMSKVTSGVKSCLIYQLINKDKEKQRENQLKYPRRNPLLDIYGRHGLERISNLIRRC